jgi:phosphonate transport system substrate-binding protein
MLRTIAALFALALAGCAPEPEPKEAALRFSILSSESQAVQSQDWGPLLSDMAKAIGRPVEPSFGPNYSVLIEAMRFGQTQIGWFGNASAIEAADRADGEVFAAAVRADRVGGYTGVMIVRAGGGLTFERVIACDRSLSFGAADPQSTSGVLAPIATLWGPRGLDPETCFKTSRTGSHEANIMAIANGLTDVAIVDSTVLDRIAARSPETAARVKRIWNTPLLPNDPLVWRRDLDPTLKQRIAAFLTAYGQGDGPEAERQRGVLAKLGFSGFQRADDSYLAATRAQKAWVAVLEARRSGDAAKIKAAEAKVQTTASR